jgi:two-component system cell cycle response regulator DivK
MVKTILIVEDNDLNMKLFNDLLQAHGYNTLQSMEGCDVMSLAHEHKPDLILMDIKLPGISGLEVTKMLKADNDLKSIPVIAVTAFAMKGDEEKIRDGGCDEFVTKPISIPTLLDIVAKFLS